MAFRDPRIPALALAAVVAVAANPLAAGEAHVHGKGHLNVALEGGELTLELIAPGADIVGFEYQPKTDAQRDAVARAAETLKDAAALFVLPSAADCRVSETRVESELMADDHGHGHNHDHGGSDGHAHAEFLGTYVFTCAVPAALDAIDVAVFDAFPSLARLAARTVTANGQAATTLTASAATLSLR